MRCHRLTPVVLLVGVAAVGAALAAPPAPTCRKVVATSVAEPGGSANRGFSATRTVDLTFSLEFKDKSAAGHVAHLRVFTPDGYLYRAMAQPIAALNAKGAMRSVSGYPQPVREQTLRNVSATGASRYAIDFTFPVGGTDIVSTGLYGTWKVEPYVDDAAAPCAKATSFMLGP